MNPLDLLKVKFQVSTRGPEGGVGRGIWRALRDIHASEGLRGLYRGLSPNVAGNATSWGLYFLLCVRSSLCARSLEEESEPAAATISLRAARPSMRQTDLCQLLNIYFFPPKRVCILLFFSRRSTPVPLTNSFCSVLRCRDGHPD
jgi:hypothetical protein